MQQVKLVLMRMMNKQANVVRLIVNALRQLEQQTLMSKRATVVRLIVNALRQLEPLRPLNKQATVVRPVSYTHLTLPTKRIV